MSRKTDFHLSKWYLDCIAANGDAFIGYAATLRWKSFSIHYSSVLSCTEHSGTSSQMSLKKDNDPSCAGCGIDWSSNSLNLNGSWVSLSKPIERRLYESPEGILQWSCMQPKARSSVSFGRNEHLEGLGYVEHLELTVRPWMLPISELHWGRFLSDRDALVWIEWRGSKPLSLAVWNDRIMDQPVITEQGISFNQGETSLSLTERKELRKGPLLSTALSMIPGIEVIFPRKILHSHECKWRSRGLLNSGHSQPDVGWAIHEIVRFQ
jgi:hypothetical protein